MTLVSYLLAAVPCEIPQMGITKVLYNLVFQGDILQCHANVLHNSCPLTV